MNYTIYYYKNCPMLDTVSEIIINYYKKDPELIKFVEQRPQEQRIVVNINADISIEDNLEIFNAAHKAHLRFAIRINKDDHLSYIDLAEANIPFFFIQPITTLDELHTVVQSHVSDVYIAGELGFMLHKISPYLHRNGIIVRVIPNSADFVKYDNFKTFFIRPEDVVFYKSYVDVFEFICATDKQHTYIEIYKQGSWNGRLNEIINNLRSDIDNTTIMPMFGKTRAKCEKRCAYEGCNLCDIIAETGKTLNDKSIQIIKDKRKEL